MFLVLLSVLQKTCEIYTQEWNRSSVYVVRSVFLVFSHCPQVVRLFSRPVFPGYDVAVACHMPHILRPSFMLHPPCRGRRRPGETVDDLVAKLVDQDAGDDDPRAAGRNKCQWARREQKRRVHLLWDDPKDKQMNGRVVSNVCEPREGFVEPCSMPTRLALLHEAPPHRNWTNSQYNTVLTNVVKNALYPTNTANAAARPVSTPLPFPFPLYHIPRYIKYPRVSAPFTTVCAVFHPPPAFHSFHPYVQSSSHWIAYGAHTGQCHLPPGMLCGRRRTYPMSQRTSGSEKKSQASVKVDGVWDQAGSAAARGVRVLVGDDMGGGEEERPPRGVSRAAEEERVETI